MSAALTNVNGCDDQFYRYKRPTILVKQITNFTELTNIKEICAKLGRSEGLLLTFLQIKLATQSKGSSLRGNFTVKQLEDLILSFTKEFVLCRSCKNPETILKMSKGSVRMSCSCCGQTSSIKMDERLSKRIKLVA